MSVLSQLQSRIDRRRNEITELQDTIVHCYVELAAAKKEDRSDDATFWRNAAAACKEDLAEVVVDQKLDKRVYGELVDEIRARRYYHRLTMKQAEAFLTPQA